MKTQRSERSKKPSSLYDGENYIEARIGDPSYQILDLLDNTWGGHMAKYDGAYSEGQDIPKRELERVISILKQMERNVAIVRSEFGRRLTGS